MEARPGEKEPVSAGSGRVGAKIEKEPVPAGSGRGGAKTEKKPFATDPGLRKGDAIAAESGPEGEKKVAYD
jgi:hypothetical protein